MPNDTTPSKGCKRRSVGCETCAIKQALAVQTNLNREKLETLACMGRETNVDSASTAAPDAPDVPDVPEKFDQQDNENIRDEMARRLPRRLQPVLTTFTGKAHRGQEAPKAQSRIWYTVFSIITLFLSVAGAALSYTSGQFLLLVIFTLTTTGAARKIQLSPVHHAVHNNITGKPWIDRLIAEFTTALLVIQNAASYAAEHLAHHKGRVLATSSDADWRFLHRLGFRAGMPKRQLWKTLGTTILSPKFHRLFLWARCKSNFGPGLRLWRRSLPIMIHAPIIIFAIASGRWSTYLVAWVLPLTLLYHVAALLQFTSEHYWMLDVDTLDLKGRIARLTSARFCGEALPKQSVWSFKGAFLWGQWLARMFLIHLPARIVILPGCLPSHDWHHRHAQHPNWPNAPYERQRDIEAGVPNWDIEYTEVWGLHNALDRVFEELSKIPSAEAPPTSDTQSHDDLLGM